VYEAVAIDEEMAKLITDEPDMKSLKETAIKKNYSSLWHNAIRKMLNGTTTVEEVLRVVTPDPLFNEPVHLRKTDDE
jgi:type II secretory ATPase GspE/PulE/Tfp pilus assembly ATPase PilB-like protein